MGLVLVLAFVAPSQDDFWPVLKTASNESIQDARFNFEFEGAPVEDGEWQRQSTDKGTGIGAYHSDGVVYSDHYSEGADGVTRELLSVRRNGETRKATLTGTPFADYQTREPAQWRWLTHRPEFTYLWPMPMFELLPNSAHSTTRLEGYEEIDGRRCAVVVLDADSQSWRCWVDMERGANVLRAETTMFDLPNPSVRLHSVELNEVVDAGGTRRWFPKSGIVDMHHIFPPKGTKGRVTAGKEPTYRYKYRILASTVRLNTGRPSEEFELQFDRKIRMVDLAKQKHVVLPKEEMPTQNVVAQADVERALKEADDQQIDLLAQRPAAQPRDWLSWLGVAFGVLGLSALAVVLYLRRG